MNVCVDVLCPVEQMRKGVSVRRGIRMNVLKRVAANRQRIEDARQRDEREREVLRLLNQRPNQVKETVK